MKIAIVGGGPRGLWATEELMNLAWQRGLALDVTVFDAGGVKAYDPNQPDYWLLNAPAEIVESTTLGSFNEYTGNTEKYPARAQVGKFLAKSWDTLPVPPECTLNRVARLVADPRELTSTYDHVLDVTGHETSWPGEMPDALKVYPHGSLDQVMPGSTVAIRGTALTFIDAVLDLTLGRGGHIKDGLYHPSGYEPAQIIPVNRSGRFMNVKPDVSPNVDDVVDRFGAAVLAATTTEEIVATLQAAAGLLTSDTDQDIAAVLAGADAPEDGVEELRHSLQVALGEKPLDARAAVGVVFRALYPQLVELISFHEPLPGFRELARILEPVAFGPPSLSAQRVLALIDAGFIASPMTGDLPEADVTIDAVQAPPPNPPVRTDRDGFLPGCDNFAVIGRATELWVLGNDTLSRAYHDVIPRWARRVVAGISPARVHGIPPMQARLEPWASEFVGSFAEADDLITRYGSPVNVLHSEPMLRNAQELVDAGTQHGVDVRVFFARKANKALTFVDAIHQAGHGVDVASFRELEQVLGRGVPGENIILSAAIKSEQLLRLAVERGVTISVDNVTELRRITTLADRPVRVAPRLAPNPNRLPPTRFGERTTTWIDALTSIDLGHVQVTGVHVHLHGYSAADRVTALREAFALIDVLPHDIEFIDLGGGVPMSYLADAGEWDRFQTLRTTQHIAPFTWKNDPLATIYPYWQTPTRGEWLDNILSAEGIASGLTERGLRLHVEPGRSLLDGCGLILAQVEFVKTRSDGLPLVGLAMNRTQCRTTSDDYTVDPLLIRSPNSAPGPEIEAFLVGAYCIEDEIILRRRIRFPEGVSPGDIVAIPNTAGYFMHILESASHQIPLAKNVVWPNGTLDAIDEA
ncbi:Diaminopimelate decarboxylase [Corynebacterium kalinowskii]|uniref:Diaminopimelate decarboxylase n=1 Tax=Corynebacterium kalinowskii TaxID=2675216 RepID=A0A6B8VMH6_9CORY|nr:FAD/NAD(P)-binding protein [Corynebacterium kalinowskii]QGU00911.1 Diaminopimelate decarboxylase [Corynebacterium kalinowskii]